MKDSTINISSADSSVAIVASDTVATYNPAYPGGFKSRLGNDSVVAKIELRETMQIPNGSAPANHRNSLLQDSGTMAILLAGLLAVLVTYRSGYKYIHNIRHSLFSVKMRDFEDHTMDETKILSALTANSIITQSLFLFIALAHRYQNLKEILYSEIFPHVLILMGMITIFYFAQLALYRLLGYVFGTEAQTECVLTGFKAVISLIGLILFPIVAVSLVEPKLINVMLLIGTISYFCARIIFIIKGFRIFYNNLLSSVYFILYLCTVEIVPAVLLWSISAYVCSVF